jgi:hypothetical protein
MDEYREQLVNFQKNYWSFLKPSKGGSKFIPSPPLTLIKKTNEMSSRKLSEHVEQELFDKEKRVIVNPEKVIKTKPVIVKESVLGATEDKPVKKKKPYYRKKYNKPKPVEVVEEPVKSDYSIKAFTIGLIFGIIATFIVINLIK